MMLKSFTKPSNSFTGNVLKLVTGTVLAQALGILAMPIVTRLFDPEAFGILALFTAIAGIVGVIACLRYHLAIMLPESNEEAANILGISLLSVFIMTSLATLTVWLGNEKIINLLNAPQLRNYLWLVPIAIFFSGTFLALNFWNSRTKHFGRLSVAQVTASLTTQTAKLTAGFAGFISGGILIGTSVLGSVVSTATLGGQIWRDDKKFFLDNIRWSAIGKGYVRFRKFPLIDTWSALLNATSWQLPALMLSSFFSLSVVGFYSLGVTVVKGPLGIIGTSLSQVFYQKACNEKNIKGNNAELVENLMDKLMLVGILPTVVLTIVGEELFVIAFGERWAEAGLYTQILAPWVLIWFISVPLGAILSVYERQGTALSLNFFIFITRFISLYIGGIYQNIYLALGLFSASGIVAFGLMAVLNIRLSGANGRRILFNFFKYSLHSLPILLCLFLFKYTFQFGPVVLLSSAVAMGLIYVFLFRHKIQSFMEL